VISEEAFAESWRRGALAALAVRDPVGGVTAEVVVPLADGEQPVVALPFARTPLARATLTTGHAVLACWDSRLAEVGWRPLAASVRVEVAEDRDGRWLADGLLQQELRVHPPSRALLDTPLLRREHWWYVPRWILRVTDITSVWPLTRRAGLTSGLLVWEGDGRRDLGAAVVEVPRWEGEQIPLAALPGGDPVEARGSAALLASDVRTPDLDHTAELRLRGRVEGSVLAVEQRTGAPALGPPPTLWARLTAARRLERACRSAIGR
jgi:hypothetical protein